MLSHFGDRATVALTCCFLLIFNPLRAQECYSNVHNGYAGNVGTIASDGKIEVKYGISSALHPNARQAAVNAINAWNTHQGTTNTRFVPAGPGELQEIFFYEQDGGAPPNLNQCASWSGSGGIYMTEHFGDNGTVQELTGIYKHELLHFFGVKNAGAAPQPPTLANAMVNLDYSKSCIDNLRAPGSAGFVTKDILSGDVAAAADCVGQARDGVGYPYGFRHEEQFHNVPPDGGTCIKEWQVTEFWVCTDTCSLDSITMDLVHSDCPPQY